MNEDKARPNRDLVNALLASEERAEAKERDSFLAHVLVSAIEKEEYSAVLMSALTKTVASE